MHMFHVSVFKIVYENIYHVLLLRIYLIKLFQFMTIA